MAKKPFVKTYNAFLSRLQINISDDKVIILRSRETGFTSNRFEIELKETYRTEDQEITTPPEEPGGESMTETIQITVPESYQLDFYFLRDAEVTFSEGGNRFLSELSIISDEEKTYTLQFKDDKSWDVIVEDVTISNFKNGRVYRSDDIILALPPFDYVIGETVTIKTINRQETFISSTPQGLIAEINNSSNYIKGSVYSGPWTPTNGTEGDAVVFPSIKNQTIPSYNEEFIQGGLANNGKRYEREYDRVFMQGGQGLPEKPDQTYTGPHISLIHINYSEIDGPIKVVNTIFRWVTNDWVKDNPKKNY